MTGFVSLLVAIGIVGTFIGIQQCNEIRKRITAVVPPDADEKAIFIQLGCITIMTIGAVFVWFKLPSPNPHLLSSFEPGQEYHLIEGPFPAQKDSIYLIRDASGKTKVFFDTRSTLTVPQQFVATKDEYNQLHLRSLEPTLDQQALAAELTLIKQQLFLDQKSDIEIQTIPLEQAIELPNEFEVTLNSIRKEKYSHHLQLVISKGNRRREKSELIFRSPIDEKWITLIDLEKFGSAHNLHIINMDPIQKQVTFAIEEKNPDNLLHISHTR